jgi:hypothetical protein
MGLNIVGAIRWVFFFALLMTNARAERGWSVDEAKSLLEYWRTAQNIGTFENYRALYSPNFRGVRRSSGRTLSLEYDAWMKERARMFRKPINVGVSDVTADPLEDGFALNFHQTFVQGSYHDEGNKRMRLVREGDVLHIVSEEMLDSSVISPGDALDGNAFGVIVYLGDRALPEENSRSDMIFSLPRHGRHNAEYPKILTSGVLGLPEGHRVALVAASDDETVASVLCGLSA